MVQSGDLVSQYTSPKNGRDYNYMVVAGTSFASPMVAGIIALMLQISPDLKPEQIKTIIHKTAIKDLHTTLNPDSTKWGFGKIDAYAAIKETIHLEGGIVISKNQDSISIYPNPSQGFFTLFYDSQSSGYFCVEVSDSIGNLVQKKIWKIAKGKNQIEINHLESNKGLYNISIIGQYGQIEKKLIQE